MAIRRFKDTGTEDIYNNRNTDKARKLLDPDLWERARRLLNHLDTPNCIEQLKSVYSFRLKALRHEYTGYWAARINGRMRVIFRYDEENDEAYDVQIIDYH